MSVEKKDSILLNNVNIINFRGIKKCDVDDLSLVNLFVGINNSRKSTLLDAIYIGCKEPKISSLIPVIKERVQREVLPYEIFYGYDVNSKAEVKLKYNNDYEYSILFSIAESEIELQEKSKIEEGQLYSCFENDKGPTYLIVYGRNKIPNQVNKLNLGKGVDRYCNNAKMFSSTIKKNELTNTLDNMLGQIKTKYKIEQDLITRMSDIYGEEFDYEFIPRIEDRKDKRVTFGNERIYSDLYGDGMQRALLILSTLELSADTAIFIEEVEIFQHPSALKRLAKHTVDLAKKNRVQLFITTHNYMDAFKAYSDELGEHGFNTAEERKKLFRSYLVTNNSGVVDAKVENNPSKYFEELYSQSR